MKLGFMLVSIDSILDALDGIRVHLHFDTQDYLIHVKFISSKKKKPPSKPKTKQPIEKQIKHISCIMSSFAFLNL
jgi:hypothetical protein